MSDNHKAIVTKVRTSKHPNADILQLGSCDGFCVVVGLDTRDEELGLYFNEGLQLSPEFAQANDLIRRKDEKGNTCGGLFDSNRKVRVQKLRGVRSEGFWCPLSYLDFTKYDLTKLKEGDLIDSLNGIPICNKFVTRATFAKSESNRKANRSQTKWFPKHFDTKQFRFFADKIPAGSLLSITTKVHGTSQRLGYVQDEKELKWYHKLGLKVGLPLETTEFRYLGGTRNVLLDKLTTGFYSNDFRERASLPFYGKLRRGELVFYEVVGYENGEAPIMPRVYTDKLKDKEIQKRWGTSVVYDYGCPTGQFDIYVYRIALSMPDGHIIDLPWNDVKRRCVQMGIKHVPEEVPVFVYDGNVENLTKLVEELTEKDDPLFTQHPKEGVVVRVDNCTELTCYKSKSFVFKLLEGIIKEDETYVDTEEAA